MPVPMTFEQWMIEVDKLLIATVGLGNDDLDDFNWFDFYEDMNSPREAVEDWALANLWEPVTIQGDTL